MPWPATTNPARRSKQGRFRGCAIFPTNRLAAPIGRRVSVGLALAPGPQHDLLACAPLAPHLAGQWVLGDKGFDSDAFRQDLIRTGANVCIPSRSSRRAPRYYSQRLYRHRHTVENFFGRIKRHRRIATRYEKRAVTFLGFVYLAALIDWIAFEV